MIVTIDQLVGIEECVKSAAHTQGVEPEEIKMTPEKWLAWLHAEHSPIRVMQLRINMIDIPYYSAMHMVRHTQGVIPFVRSQRPEARNSVLYDRRKAPQDVPVSYRPIMNPQTLINVSRRRLCSRADETTRLIWEIAKAAIATDPDLYIKQIAKVMVPDCIYRGACHELQSCGHMPHWKGIHNVQS